MLTETTVNSIYDLANDHFRATEIITNNNKKLKGRFVRFRLSGNIGDCVFPASKFCFLPEEYYGKFLKDLKKHKNLIPSFTEYIIEL